MTRDKPLARNTDPWTSHSAGEVVRPHLGKIQALVLEVFTARGAMTARDAEGLPEFSPYGFSTIRKRISELAVAGRLISVGVDCTGRAPCMIYAVPLFDPYFFREPVLQPWPHLQPQDEGRPMNIAITFEIQNATAEQAKYLLASIASMSGGAQLQNSVTKAVATPEPDDAPPLDAESADAVKARKAAQAKARRAKKKAEKDAADAAGAAGEIVDDDPLGVGDLDAEPVTLEDLKTAMRERIEASNVEEVKAIFAEFGAAKITGLAEESYADVIAKLKG